MLVKYENHHLTLELVRTSDCEASLNAILEHSLVKTENDIFAELDAIKGKKGTRIIIWNLKSEKIGCTEFDFETDPYDIKIPEENGQFIDKTYKQDRNGQVAPESDFSLRAYCSILYLKPKMQIIIRGEKVQTQYVSKNLAFIEKDVYKPTFLDQSVTMTFGFNCQNKQHYGIMMYHRNRLIKSYVRVGCQLKANYMGIGVVGIIECNFLKPTHNKQDFDYTREYRLTLSALGSKLDDYWVEKKVKLKTVTGGFLEKEKKPDQTWVQCDECLHWRKLPDGIGKLPEKWYCHMNPDPQFRDCNVPEEPEDDEEITQPTYEKTNKKRKSEMLQQVSNTPTIQSIPLDEKMKVALSNVQAFFSSDPLPGPSSATPGTAGRVRLQANRKSGPSHQVSKKPTIQSAPHDQLMQVVLSHVQELYSTDPLPGPFSATPETSGRFLPNK
ncbi:MORC family CW-type zinc finger protein 3-like [Pyxicephalus adspersus]|uniref:MORC family CW-type zinc finger protein 3-like n=1 Tax=Pyxicephalus adspersus TaxID=30357 RepID=UPI003B5A4DF3